MHYVNNAILAIASKIKYSVADDAPGTENALFGRCGPLIVWSGASDHTIYGDPSVNYAFRAWHDSLHLKHGLGFTVDAEIELGRIQASQCLSPFVADLIYCEVAGQAEHFRQTGEFVKDQVAFTKAYMAKKFRVIL